MNAKDNFRSDYVEFYRGWQSLCNGYIQFVEFSVVRDKVIDSLIALSVDVGVEYTKMIEYELRKLFMGENNIGFIYYHCSVLDLINEEEFRDPEIYMQFLFMAISRYCPDNISATLRLVGFSIIESGKWKWDVIGLVMSAINLFFDPIVLDLVDRIIDTSKADWYHDDIGQDIELYLIELKTFDALQVAFVHLDHPVIRLREHLESVVAFYRAQIQL